MKFIETLKKIEIMILGNSTLKSEKQTRHWQKYRKSKRKTD
tara:strand:- start:197 stop:319 length:123 start_codon:yes stop_codon:yes gene_type:complete